MIFFFFPDNNNFSFQQQSQQQLFSTSRTNSDEQASHKPGAPRATDGVSYAYTQGESLQTKNVDGTIGYWLSSQVKENPFCNAVRVTHQKLSWSFQDLKVICIRCPSPASSNFPGTQRFFFFFPSDAAPSSAPFGSIRQRIARSGHSIRG